MVFSDSTTSHKFLPLAQLFLGVSMIVFAIIDFSEVKWWTSKTAFGIWTGCLVFLTGASGMVAIRLSCSSIWGNTYKALCGLSTMTSFAVIVAYSLALEEVTRDMRLRSYQPISTQSTRTLTLQTGSLLTQLAITSTILVLAVMEFIVSVWSILLHCGLIVHSNLTCQHRCTASSPSPRVTQYKETFYTPSEVVTSSFQANQAKIKTKPQSVSMNQDFAVDYQDGRRKKPRRQVEAGSIGPSPLGTNSNQPPTRSYTREPSYPTEAVNQRNIQGKQNNKAKNFPSERVLQEKIISSSGNGEPEKTYI